ncbi:MAG: OmpA family protein, partial [Bacteroidia bacterium]|nr:OmpA family protein [Bacteroidia bacterium]
YNMKLSLKRAQSCMNYLIAKGIPKARLKAVGYGETRPINDCDDCTDEEHQQNRRTTFRVLRSDYKN